MVRRNENVWLGFIKARYRTYVTPKGIQWLAKKLGKAPPGQGPFDQVA
jgi:hypothetical protein